MNPYIEVARRFLECRNLGTSHEISTGQYKKSESSAHITKPRTASCRSEENDMPEASAGSGRRSAAGFVAPAVHKKAAKV
jgi:hypothetical protein